MSETISVIIPTYNRAQLLAEAIDSVLEQTRVVEEIIVIDDGSTDDTDAVLARYGQRIKSVRQENAGVNAARNRALDISSGSFIALLDNDDVWLPFKTELEMAVLEKYTDSGFVFSDFYIWKPGVSRRPKGLSTWHNDSLDWSKVFAGRRALSGLMQSSEFSDEEEFDIFWGDIYPASLVEPFVLPSTAIIRRACLGDLRFDANDSTCGDWSLFAQLSKRHGAVYVDTETALNRSHEDDVRLTRIDQGLQLERRLRMVQRVWASDPDFEKRNPGRANRVAVSLLHRRARIELRSDQPARAIPFLDQALSLALGSSIIENTLLRVLATAPRALSVARVLKRLHRRPRA